MTDAPDILAGLTVSDADVRDMLAVVERAVGAGGACGICRAHFAPSETRVGSGRYWWTHEDCLSRARA